MATEKSKLGRIPCPGCDRSVMVRENASHTLSLDCDECDLHCYAKAGSVIAGRWRAACPQVVQAPAAPPAVAQPVAVGKPRKTAAAFSLEEL